MVFQCLRSEQVWTATSRRRGNMNGVTIHPMGMETYLFVVRGGDTTPTAKYRRIHSSRTGPNVYKVVASAPWLTRIVQTTVECAMHRRYSARRKLLRSVVASKSLRACHQI